MSQPATFSEQFSLRAFSHALLAGILLIGGLWFIAFLGAEETLEKLRASLNSRTVLITAPEDIEQPTEEAPTLETIGSYMPTENRKSLYPAPITGLFEKTSKGLMPRVSQNGVTPFDAYKKPFPPASTPLIALAILDYGLQDSMAEKILASVPDAVSLILSPYAPAMEKWQEEARKNGFETWLHLPTLTAGFLSDDPGSKALLPHLGKQENRDTLVWLMTRTTGYAGVAMETDNVLAQSKTLPDVLVENTLGRGLGFFEMNPQAPILIETQALSRGRPFLHSNMALDDKSFKELEQTAREQGYAIGVIHPYPATLKALNIWSDTLAAKGLTLAPLSAVWDMQKSIEPPPSATSEETAGEHAATPPHEETPPEPHPADSHHE